MTAGGSCFPLAGSLNYGLLHTSRETDGSGKLALEANEITKAKLRTFKLSYFEEGFNSLKKYMYMHTHHEYRVLHPREKKIKNCKDTCMYY